MNLKKITFILMLFILFIFLGTTNSHASLYLNNLDFNAQINSDGSMNVIETWDIDVSDTNTLYKTFRRDSSMYKSLTNINVKEITSGKENNFRETNRWAYHLDKGSYFGGINEDGEYEIAWGVSIDSNTTRKYQISYTVEDCIKKYKDCSEIYWQFLGNEFEVDANKITGTIKLPGIVESKDDVKVWGHTEFLNGEIYFVDNQTVQFHVDNYRGNSYVEARVVMPNYLFPNINYISNTDKIDEIVEQETIWAEEANARRVRRDNLMKRVAVIVTAILGAISVFDIRKIGKYKKELEENPKIKPEMELDYYRDVPDETATPAEAQYMLLRMQNISTSLSASILDLVLKGYLRAEQNDKKIDLSIVENKDKVELPEDERRVLELIEKAYNSNKKAQNENHTITMKQLEKYIKNHPTSFETLSSKISDIAKNSAVKKGKYDKKREEKGIGYVAKTSGYIVICIISFIAMVMVSLYIAGFVDSMQKYIVGFGAIAIIIAVINIVMCGKLASRFNGFTQKGENEREQWKAFKKYMQDFSLLNEREVPELVLWEKFLVYATAFGIADKVIKQLKVKYPELNNGDTLNNMVLFSAMSGPNGLNTNFVSSLNTSTAHMYSSTMSSGSGSGGGFSGGGGFGGRWWWPEAADSIQKPEVRGRISDIRFYLNFNMI